MAAGSTSIGRRCPLDVVIETSAKFSLQGLCYAGADRVVVGHCRARYLAG